MTFVIVATVSGRYLSRPSPHLPHPWSRNPNDARHFETREEARAYAAGRIGPAWEIREDRNR